MPPPEWYTRTVVAAVAGDREGVRVCLESGPQSNGRGGDANTAIEAPRAAPRIAGTSNGVHVASIHRGPPCPASCGDPVAAPGCAYVQGWLLTRTRSGSRGPGTRVPTPRASIPSQGCRCSGTTPRSSPPRSLTSASLWGTPGRPFRDSEASPLPLLALCSRVVYTCSTQRHSCWESLA